MTWFLQGPSQGFLSYASFSKLHISTVFNSCKQRFMVCLITCDEAALNLSLLKRVLQLAIQKQKCNEFQLYNISLAVVAGMKKTNDHAKPTQVQRYKIKMFFCTI